MRVTYAMHVVHVMYITCFAVNTAFSHSTYLEISRTYHHILVNSIGTTTSCCNSGNLPFNNFGKTRWDLACPTLQLHWFFPCPLARKWWDSNPPKTTWTSHPFINVSLSIGWFRIFAWKKRLFQPNYPCLNWLIGVSGFSKTPLEFEMDPERVCISKEFVFF